jgi:hypothetical protein
MPRVHKMDQVILVEETQSYTDSGGTRRQRKVTREVTRRERFLELMGEGTFITTGAALVGLGESTIHEWRRKGEKARSGRYRDFATDLHRARAEGELRRQRACTAVAVGEGDARTLLKMMQICYPHWRIPKEHQITVDATGPAVETVRQVSKMTPEQLEVLVAVDLDELDGLRLPTDDPRDRPTTDTEEPD